MQQLSQLRSRQPGERVATAFLAPPRLPAVQLAPSAAPFFRSVASTRLLPALPCCSGLAERRQVQRPPLVRRSLFSASPSEHPSPAVAQQPATAPLLDTFSRARLDSEHQADRSRRGKRDISKYIRRPETHPGIARPSWKKQLPANYVDPFDQDTPSPTPSPIPPPSPLPRSRPGVPVLHYFEQQCEKGSLTRLLQLSPLQPPVAQLSASAVGNSPTPASSPLRDNIQPKTSTAAQTHLSQQPTPPLVDSLASSSLFAPFLPFLHPLPELPSVHHTAPALFERQSVDSGCSSTDSSSPPSTPTTRTSSPGHPFSSPSSSVLFTPPSLSFCDLDIEWDEHFAQLCDPSNLTTGSAIDSFDSQSDSIVKESAQLFKRSDVHAFFPSKLNFFQSLLDYPPLSHSSSTVVYSAHVSMEQPNQHSLPHQSVHTSQTASDTELALSVPNPSTMLTSPAADTHQSTVASSPAALPPPSPSQTIAPALLTCSVVGANQPSTVVTGVGRVLSGEDSSQVIQNAAFDDQAMVALLPVSSTLSSASVTQQAAVSATTPPAQQTATPAPTTPLAVRTTAATQQTSMIWFDESEWSIELLAIAAKLQRRSNNSVTPYVQLAWRRQSSTSYIYLNKLPDSYMLLVRWDDEYTIEQLDGKQERDLADSSFAALYPQETRDAIRQLAIPSGPVSLLQMMIDMSYVLPEVEQLLMTKIPRLTRVSSVELKALTEWQTRVIRIANTAGCIEWYTIVIYCRDQALKWAVFLREYDAQQDGPRVMLLTTPNVLLRHQHRVSADPGGGEEIQPLHLLHTADLALSCMERKVTSRTAHAGSFWPYVEETASGAVSSSSSASFTFPRSPAFDTPVLQVVVTGQLLSVFWRRIIETTQSVVQNLHLEMESEPPFPPLVLGDDTA